MGALKGGSRLTLRREDWSPAAARDLAVIDLGPASTISEAWFARLVGTGDLALVAGYVEGRRIGTLLYRIDAGDLAEEFVIVHAAARVPRVDLTASVIPYFEDLARRLGCISIRAHVERRGMVAKLKGIGWGPSEIVMRKVFA